MAADRTSPNNSTQKRLLSTTKAPTAAGHGSDLTEANDGGWGWFIVIGSFLAHVLAGGLDRSGGIFYLIFLDRYGGSAVETAWVTALFTSFRTLFGPLASTMVSRFSGRIVVFAGAVLSMTGILVSGYTDGLLPLYFSYGICTGIGTSFTFTPGIILTGQYFNKRRGAAICLASVGAGVGSFLFPPLIQLLFETLTFERTYLLLSGIVSHNLVVSALYRPLDLHKRLILASHRASGTQLEVDAVSTVEAPLLEAPDIDNTLNVKTDINGSPEYISTNTSEDIPDDSTQTIEKKRAPLPQINHTSKLEETKTPRVFDVALFKDLVFVCICLQSFLFLISLNITLTFVPALVKDQGLTAFQGSTLISIMGVSDALGRIIASIVLDMKPVKSYRLYAFNGIILFTLVVSTLLPSLSQFWHFVLMCGIYGSLTGAYISQRSVVIIDVVGVENVASGIGIGLGVNGLSALIAPTFGGFLRDTFGTYTPAFYFGSAGLVLSAGVMAFGIFCFHRKQKNQTM